MTDDRSPEDTFRGLCFHRMSPLSARGIVSHITGDIDMVPYPARRSRSPHFVDSYTVPLLSLVGEGWTIKRKGTR